MPARKPTSLLGALLLTACAASQPLVDRTVVNTTASPTAIAAGSVESDQVVNWGGQVLELRRAGEATEIEVLSYPVRNTGRPDDLANSDGRFIAVSTTPIDPLQFAAGRLVTITGRVTRIEEGRVGDRSVRLPVVDVIELSRVPERRDTVQPFFSIGVGIGF